MLTDNKGPCLTNFRRKAMVGWAWNDPYSA